MTGSAGKSMPTAPTQSAALRSRASFEIRESGGGAGRTPPLPDRLRGLQSRRLLVTALPLFVVVVADVQEPFRAGETGSEGRNRAGAQVHTPDGARHR